MSYEEKIKQLYQALRAERRALERKIDDIRSQKQEVIVESDPKQIKHIDKLRERIKKLEEENHTIKQERDDLQRRLDRLRGLV